jgi:putative acetyltransferase
MDIRPQNADDHAAVRELHLAAFGDHGRVVADLVDGLREAHGEGAVGLVATDGDEVIGHVLFTPGLLDAPRRLVEVAVLSPVAVSPARQRQGPDDAFQALPMPSYEPWMTGTLVYSHVFWEHDAVGLREPAGYE